MNETVAKTFAVGRTSRTSIHNAFPAQDRDNSIALMRRLLPIPRLSTAILFRDPANPELPNRCLG